MHGGLVGGRWVKGQEAHIARIAPGVYKMSWTEPIGTCVSLAFNLAERRSDGATFFPRWIVEDPKKIVCFQNEHLDLMQSYRKAGPTYPIEVVDEFSRITLSRIAAATTRRSSRVPLRTCRKAIRRAAADVTNGTKAKTWTGFA